MIIMEKFIEGVAYYCSCMMLFNLIFALKMINDGVIKKEFQTLNQYINIDFITFVCSLLFLLAGMFFTVVILLTNERVGKATLGKKVTAIEVKELTTDYYFTNFSLLVLTGLSIPSCNGWASSLIYFFIIVTLGIVYIKKNAFYINPVLTLFNFNVFQCKAKENNKSYIIVIKDKFIKENEELILPNINKKIIKIN